MTTTKMRRNRPWNELRDRILVTLIERLATTPEVVARCAYDVPHGRERTLAVLYRMESRGLVERIDPWRSLYPRPGRPAWRWRLTDRGHRAAAVWVRKGGAA